MAPKSRAESRRADAMAGVPQGELLASYTKYGEAHALVGRLVKGGVPPTSLAIIGGDVTVVERVTGAMGQGRAALSAAITGSWVGALLGLMYFLFSSDEALTPIAAGALIGAGLGMVAGIVLFTFTPGPKPNFRSVQGVVATSYTVVVAPPAHASAVAAMAAPVKTEEP